MIPDMPKVVEDFMNREELIAKKKVSRLISGRNLKIARSGFLVGKFNENDYGKIVNYDKEYI